ncbi:MAG: DNA mismatch repair protein MutS [Butyrivibrio sp.]|nr:DNA mismatch repair protein MutS [Butyrivibrio sp.]
MEQVSPMMREYLKTKEEYPGCILFYRLGDFYEMFFEDAEIVSKELELTLTGKACGLEERAPMCGVPYHAVDVYLSKLVDRGYKVAICEQMEDPKEAKGIVRREVIRVVTPGTNLNMQALEETRNNYLMSILYTADKTGISVADITTGDYYLTEGASLRAIIDEITKYAPAELICNEAFLLSGIDLSELKSRMHIVINPLEDRYYDEDRTKKLLIRHFHVHSLQALGITDFPLGIIAAGALLQYITDMQKSELSVFTHLYPYLSGRYMLLDAATRRNLELTETLRDKTKRGSLLWVLDKTKTAMGGRMLRSFIEQPLVDLTEIRKRQEAVAALVASPITREEIREYLSPIYDLERLLSKVIYKTANPRDLLAFGQSLKTLPGIRIALSECNADGVFDTLLEELDPLEELCALIGRAIVDEPPLTVREGGLIRTGYHEEVDRYREAGSRGKEWLAEMEEREREKTGIRNLRIKFSGVFGYSFEVTNSFLDKVPDNYIRRQTLANSERFTTPELKELENTILGAQEKCNNLEYDLFSALRDRIAGEVARIQRTAKAVARLDVYASLAAVAERQHYVRPELSDNGRLVITAGRHPVVEQMLDSAQLFIPNDTRLDNRKHAVAIITGPNMAGKSTYMRQTALIVLMAQIGSFVPADAAQIGLTDRIFTRVGASDDLASGQSTFMVEMNEVANILRNATPDSLLILDEIGRGTSTFDGLSIAWAVVEHIANHKHLGARTLFATHYHELTELEGKLDNVHNYCIAVKEKGDDIVFLRRIVKGGADKSYGIQVARLAGLPEMVIDRARQIAEELSDNDITQKTQSITVESTGSGRGRKDTVHAPDEVDLTQMTLFDTVKDEDVLKELTEIDVTQLTPMDALNTLYRLQSKLKNRWR